MTGRRPYGAFERRHQCRCRDDTTREYAYGQTKGLSDRTVGTFIVKAALLLAVDPRMLACPWVPTAAGQRLEQ